MSEHSGGRRYRRKLRGRGGGGEVCPGQGGGAQRPERGPLLRLHQQPGNSAH